MKSFNPQEYTVLIVDDIHQNIQVLANILEKAGYKVGFALNGIDALEIVETSKFDLILLDLLMPEINGLEVCKRLKKNPLYVNLPIIFLTAIHDEKSLLEAFAVGASDYVTKPFKPSELLARVKHHLEFQRTKKEAEKASKIKSQFMAIISHEIRTPLQSILGITEILMNSELKPEQLSLLETLKLSSNHLLLIINDILNISKLETKEISLKKSFFNLNTLLEETVNIVEDNVQEKKLDLNYFIRPNVPLFVKGDQIRIRQILLNIINNAIKFTSSGQIIINIIKVEKLKPEFGVDAENIADKKVYLKFSVTDTGIGIDQRNTSELFKNFSQIDISTTRQYDGIGLGLAISKKLVTLMGGEIGVESEVNQGSTFWFSLPLEIQENQPIDYQQEFLNKKVLVWQKNNYNLQFIQQTLENLGIDVVSVGDGYKLSKYGKNSLLNYDLLFLDFDDYSLELMRKKVEIESKNKAKFILIGFKKEKQAADKSLDIIPYFYIRKPLTRTKIVNCLNTALLNEDGYNSEDIANIIKTNRESKPEFPSKDQENMKILLVEDNIVNQKVITLQLRKLGYDAEIANNGQECLDKLQQEEYMVVFMDCQMPVLDGYEATKKIRAQEESNQQHQHHQIIVGLTANTIEGQRERCLGIGMDDFITKPVSIETLGKIIHKWIINY